MTHCISTNRELLYDYCEIAVNTGIRPGTETGEDFPLFDCLAIYLQTPPHAY